MLRKYLRGYKFLKQLAKGKSYCTVILVRRNLTRTLWAGKISRALPVTLPNFRDSGKDYIRTVDFQDVDNRAALGFRLAGLAGLRTLKTKIIPANLVEGLDLQTIPYPRSSNNIFLSEYKAESLPDYVAHSSFDSIKNKEEIVKSFVLNLWIGNYDNKDGDYLVDSNSRLTSIDYQLSGPGFKDNPTLALGAWGEAFSIDVAGDTGWCAGGDKGVISEYFKNVRPPFEEYLVTINKILSIPESSIKSAMKGLKFYNQGTREEIGDLYLRFLLERRLKLSDAIRSWIGAGYPSTPLPKDDGTV